MVLAEFALELALALFNVSARYAQRGRLICHGREQKSPQWRHEGRRFLLILANAHPDSTSDRNFDVVEMLRK
jgi:hypothetical protein